MNSIHRLTLKRRFDYWLHNMPSGSQISVEEAEAIFHRRVAETLSAFASKRPSVVLERTALDNPWRSELAQTVLWNVYSRHANRRRRKHIPERRAA